MAEVDIIPDNLTDPRDIARAILKAIAVRDEKISSLLAALRLAEGRLALLLREFPDTSEVSDHPVATRYVHDNIRAAIAGAEG